MGSIEFERRYHTMPSVKKQVFSGLWLAKTPLLQGNLSTVLSVLQQGLATSEYQAFVRQLETKLSSQ